MKQDVTEKDDDGNESCMRLNYLLAFSLGFLAGALLSALVQFLVYVYFA